MVDELASLRDVKPTLRQIAGFSAVYFQSADSNSSAEALAHQRPAAAIMAASVGPYGGRTKGGYCDGLDWAGTLPGPNEILSTWSDYSDDAGVCVIEGDFYAEAWGRRPEIGIDASLAKDIWIRFQTHGHDCLGELSGLFSGFLFSKAQQRFWFFVDRSGSRTINYRVECGRCEIASCVYGLRAGARPLALDPLSVNEALLFKAGLGYNTVFRGVQVAPPGKVVEVNGRELTTHRYYRYPQRRRRMSNSEIGESIASAMEQQVRYLRLPETPTIGLSGGKDSRIVCSAMTYAGVRPLGMTIVDPSQEQLLSQRIADLFGLTTELIHLDHLGAEEEFVGASCDAAVLSDGFSSGPMFQVLAACARRHSRAIFTGFVGDHLSGSSAGMSPQQIKTVKQLSDLNYAMLGKAYDSSFVSSCLAPELRVPFDAVREHWLSIHREAFADFDDLVAAHISIRVEQFNRRFAYVFQAMRPAITPVHMFAGRDVMDAYLSMPVSALNGAKAHILAAIHRYPALGQIPTTKTQRSMSLLWEYRLWRLMRAASQLKRLRARLFQKKQVFRPGDDRSQPSLRTRRFFEGIVKSQLFDVSHLKSHVEPLLNGNIYRLVHKFASVAIHAEMGLNGAFLLPPLWLPNRTSSCNTG